jgi:hypothetical protein
MKKNIVAGLALAAAVVAGPELSPAQQIAAPAIAVPRVPRISQGATVKQIVGASEITITYHRPGVNGRTIWGALLPYNEVWRAGANEPTLITFSDPVTIEGKSLKAGTYRFLVVPRQEGPWTVIFNSEVKNWGTVYDSTFDLLRLNVVPAGCPPQEWMAFSFTDLTPSSATVVLEWEKVRLAFKAEFNTLGKLDADLGDWRILNSAARFAMTQKGAEAKTLAWIDRSISLDRNGSNLRTKAEVLASQGKYAEAVKLGEESLALTKAQNASANVSVLEKLVAEWKTKK